MPTNLLRDVDVIALSIVDKGANRKRIYLRKQEGDQEEFNLPAPHGIIKSDSSDWSVFYCVVAEPDHRESAGVGPGATDVEDVWADQDEIRMAAHRFMKNGALVNRMHETLDPYGHVVENFIAQADFEVGGEVIKAGSWVIGVEPTEDGRAKIDAGEFTGVSIQGTGIRELTKGKGTQGDSKKCPSCGGTVAQERETCQNCGQSFTLSKKVDLSPDVKIPNKPGKSNWLERAGGFPRYMRKVIEDILGSHPQYLASAAGVSKAIQIGVGIVQNWAEGHDGKGHAVSKKTQAKAAAAVAEWNAKRGKSRVSKEESMNDDDKRGLMHKMGLALGLVKEDDLSDEERALIAAETDETSTLPEETMSEITKQEFDGLKETVEKSAADVTALAQRIADIADKLAEKEKANAPEEGPTAEEVYHRLEEVAKSLETVEADVQKLAKGDSSQHDDDQDRKPVNKSDSPLAGLLTD
jgi:hypothetical protein